ncbi:MAG TPA: polysaccharide biosynthesis protein, partial [Longimicrobiales bacterium]
MGALAQGGSRFIRTNRRAVVFTAYAGLTILAYTLAYLLRFDLRWPAHLTDTFWISLLALVSIRLAFGHLARLTSSQWRFISILDLVRLLMATFAGSGLFYVLTVLVPLEPRVPHSVILVEGVLTSYLIAGVWVLYRGFYEVLRRRSQQPGEERKVLIVGAGDGGFRLLRAIQRTPTPFKVLGLIDDDAFRWGTEILGVEVIGGTEDIDAIARFVRADELIIAMPSLSPAAFRRVHARCEVAGLPIKVLPGIADIITGEVRVDQLREVRIEDLLRRDPVRIDGDQTGHYLADRVVLVTGAGGSIGSELCRQIAQHHPRRLLLLGHGENSIYRSLGELRSKYPQVAVEPLIADVRDADRITDIMARYRPEIVFHAAAHKHVPLMEINVAEAIT